MSSSHPKSPARPPVSSTENREPFLSAIPQQSLFDGRSEIIPGSVNDAGVVRSALVNAIRQSGKSREALAEEMSRLSGTEVTVRRLNAFTAESREDYRFPSELTRAFCIATGDFSLIRNQVELAGFRVVTPMEFELLRLGREYLRQKRANDNVALIEKSLAGVEL